ncbi:sensor histidine kinase [Peristeroidobacter agariperforans]|uniref:sensor histidine kinase n=1 Tax=Peristeroidobacter agariperforans TaxID=268404 RepID=UPI00101CF2EE|nr:HAMP domain-containing sensor histidine kinase [Peristeroidobacter agariperforans]
MPTQAATRIVEFSAASLTDPLRILASMSHDLQTPLTRLKLRAEAMADSIERNKLIADLEEMEHLVRQGIVYARSRHGAAVTLRRIDLDACLQSLASDYRDIGKAVTLFGRIGTPWITCQHALRRTLMNLIDNALKYAGSAELCVRRVPGNSISIVVADRGPGIPPAELASVMQPFYRASSCVAGVSGAGLGLSIAHELATSLGGALSLANREGGGLLATLTLAACPASPATPARR